MTDIDERRENLKRQIVDIVLRKVDYNTDDFNNVKTQEDINRLLKRVEDLSFHRRISVIVKDSGVSYDRVIEL